MKNDMKISAYTILNQAVL